MFMTYFVDGAFLEPSAVVWFYYIAKDAIILVALWVVGRKYMA